MYALVACSANSAVAGYANNILFVVSCRNFYKNPFKKLLEACTSIF
jgi:hypothetical protein